MSEQEQVHPLEQQSSTLKAMLTPQLDLEGGDDIGGWSSSEQESARSGHSQLAREADLASVLVQTDVGATPQQPAAAAAAAEPRAFLTGTDGNRHQLMLSLLIDGGNADQISFLVQKGADVNLPDDSGNPPLMLAARQGRLDCVRALLEVGADTHGRNRLGNSAIHVAAQRGHTEVMHSPPRLRIRWPFDC